jgi:hypothetical protein
MSTRLDRTLSKSIAHLEDQGGLQYTERQLYYEVCRTLRPAPGLTLPMALGTSGLGLLLGLLLLRQPRLLIRWALADALLVGALYLVRFIPYTRPLPLSSAAFAAALRAYRTRCGEPDGLLRPAAPLELHPPASEPDLLDYGLDRLLICQHEDLAHMLRANMFHMEVKCAVTALSDPLPHPIAAMLARTPGASVFFLHDASVEGLLHAARLRAQLDIPDTIPLIAIGLRPMHAMRLHLFAERIPHTNACVHSLPLSLSTQEYGWLQRGWCAEVAAVHPVRLLLRLRRILTDTVPPAWKPFDLRSDRNIGFMTWPEA